MKCHSQAMSQVMITYYIDTTLLFLILTSVHKKICSIIPFLFFVRFNLFSSSTSFPFCACMLSLTAGWFLAGILWIDWWGHLITVSAAERGAFSYLHVLGTDTLSLFSRHQFFFSTAPELLILFVIFSFPFFSVARLYKAVLCSDDICRAIPVSWFVNDNCSCHIIIFFDTCVKANQLRQFIGIISSAIYVVLN